MKEQEQRAAATAREQGSWTGLIVLILSAFVVLATIIIGFLYFGFAPF